jgi:hypothetical protein
MKKGSNFLLFVAVVFSLLAAWNDRSTSQNTYASVSDWDVAVRAEFSGAH